MASSSGTLRAVYGQRTNEGRLRDRGTLGALLCGDPRTRPSEEEWIGLVHLIAAGDQLALRRLYERAHHLVFALILRITDCRENAEELTLEVFHDVWRRASEFDPEAATVVGWIMSLARSKAIVRFNWWSFWPRPSINLRESRVHPTGSDIAMESTSSTRATPQWEQAGSGLRYRVLAWDSERNRVSMLVRLDPGATYPPHRHGGVEELHLLDGKLWIEDRELLPGDYNRAEPGTADQLVWSQTGCTCVLVTSLGDVLG